MARCGAIVADGEKAQEKGLCHYRITGALYPGSCTLFVKCNAHFLNNAFNKATDEIKSVFQVIENLISSLHKPYVRHKLNISVPSIPKTRWVYSYDSLLCLFKNITRVSYCRRHHL